MNDQTEEKLESQIEPLLEDLPDDKDLEWAKDKFEEKMEEVEEKMTRDIDDEKKEKYALGLTRSEISNLINLGETKELEIITLGFNSPLPFDTPVFRGHGIAVPPEDPAGLCQVRMEESEVPNVGVSFDDLRDLFEPWNMVEVEATIQDADKLSNAYVIELQGNSNIEAIQSSMDEDEMRELVEGHVDEVTLQEVASNLSVQNSDGYPAEFGIDVRKIPDAYVADLNIGDNSARYVIQDDTVVDPDELSTKIRGDDIGMTCWMEKEILDYGKGSILDVYGITKTTDDGQVMANIVAVDPVLPQELEQEVDTSSSNSGGSTQSRDENVRERSI
jgi:hypothetical protein